MKIDSKKIEELSTYKMKQLLIIILNELDLDSKKIPHSLKRLFNK